MTASRGNRDYVAEEPGSCLAGEIWRRPLTPPVRGRGKPAHSFKILNKSRLYLDTFLRNTGVNPTLYQSRAQLTNQIAFVNRLPILGR